GPGFASEDIPHLFERFYRGKYERVGGIGIGLSISKSMIESQNGTVNALNLPNGGACFEIRMYSH
ncbi:MAG: sensor histidine kinase, partial [Eubacteriales bacterium]|nr:sensor histidine kinase [Eubacteriales bacterium]